VCPKTGRPKSKDPINQQISVRLNSETMQKLEKYCMAKKISKGEAVRAGVKKLLGE
jgi:hypothetical protein